MKKLVVGLIVTSVVVYGVYWVGQQRIQIGLLEGERATVTRGPLTVPITATGIIEPKQIVEIKSKASGEVDFVPFQPGLMVKTGDVLVKLDPIDEERKVEIAKRERSRALANLAKAQITEKERQQTVPAEIKRAEAGVESSKASMKLAQINLEKIERQRSSDAASSFELETYRTSYENRVADVKTAEAILETALANKHLIAMAAEDVKLAQAAVESAQTSLDDAQERLDETEVIAPIDGMVTRARGQRFVQEGEVIQDGKFALTGGTVLMEVADISELYVIASVDEADIGRVKDLAPIHARPGHEPRTGVSEGDAADTDAHAAGETDASAQVSRVAPGTPVKIRVEAFQDDVFAGEIERILPDPSRIGAVVTFDVRIRITEGNLEKLRGMLGLQAEVTFTAESVSDALLVPYDAVKRDPSGIYGVWVPVALEDGSGVEPKFRPCRIGINDGLHVQVIEGLSEGEEIYTRLPRKTDKQREAENEDE